MTSLKLVNARLACLYPSRQSDLDAAHDPVPPSPDQLDYAVSPFHGAFDLKGVPCS